MEQELILNNTQSKSTQTKYALCHMPTSMLPLTNLLAQKEQFHITPRFEAATPSSGPINPKSASYPFAQLHNFSFYLQREGRGTPK